MLKRSKKTEAHTGNRKQRKGMLAFALIFAVIGGYVIVRSFAATSNAVLYLSPSSTTVAGGGTDIAVQVRVNSGTSTVNGVAAVINYPTNLLSVSSIDVANSAFSVQAKNTFSNGVIAIERGSLTAVSGDNLVATVHFSSGTTAGAAAVNFEHICTTSSEINCSSVTDATTHNVILGTITGGTYTVTVDTPPTVSITAPTANSSVKGTTTVSANATDDKAVTSVQFKLDGANLGTADTTSPYSVSWNTTGATDGSHTLTAVATDNASPAHTTTSSSVAVTVDNTAPNTSISSNPAATTNSTSASFSFAGTDNITAAGSLTFQCQLDGGAYASCTSPKSYTGLTAGSHSFAVRALDAAGNTDATPASYTWSIDTTAPVSTITSYPPANTTSTSASFSFSATEAGTFQCKLDAGAYATCTSPKAYSGLAVGTHTFTVRATDSAGNVESSPPSYSWTIAAPDTQGPTVSITSPTGGSTVSGASVTVSATASDNVGVAGVKFYLDGTTAQLGSEDTTSPYSIVWDTTTLANGNHTLTAIARDAAGNTGTSAVVTVNVNNYVPPPPDTTAPTVPANLRSSNVTNTSANIAWDASSDPQGPNNQDVSGVATYKLYRSTSANGTYTLVVTTANTNYTDTSLTANTAYYYKVAATDNAGNTSAQSNAISFTTPITTVTLSATPTTIIAGNTSTLTWSSTNASSCTASGNWSGAKATSGSQATSALSSNSSFTLSCSGVGGSASKTVSVTVNPPKTGDLNTPPDGVVNIDDLAILLSNYGTASSIGDLNTPEDGVVNIVDLSIMLSNWG